MEVLLCVSSFEVTQNAAKMPENTGILFVGRKMKAGCV